MEAILDFVNSSGFALFAQGDNWKCLVMLLIACGLLYLGIVKKFEPLLLVPIAFGMLITNLPGAEMYHEIFFAGGHIHWDLIGGAPVTAEFLAELAAVDVSDAVLATATVGQSITPGLIDILYLGVKLGIYPCLIFMGVGAMTDFGPLIANPKSLLLGAAAQLGIFMTFVGCRMSGIFSSAQAGSIGIIGGADGPTAIYGATKLAPELLGPIAVAAYSYMALVPVIQPPIMRLLTTEAERKIVMKPLRQVSKTEKIIFPIMVAIFVALLVPSAAPLIACLMLGNLFKECGAVERLSKTVQNELINIVTIFLGVSVGATATGRTFLSLQTIAIMLMGIVAFGFGTAGGVVLAKIMNLFLKEKINPLIGSAGVSAVPMAARVSQVEGQKANPSNFLLMHAMGPNVAGVIGSAIAAGVMISLFG
ncbi:sodium ion-translocating decarboxylase subunit beta [Oscillibacter sp.]|jgi:oxaloacetate decarboxylase beta subunit|uniref:sodium ion-translocating decarboxylase subunit beta n=2 Tax=Oscillibacter sp. TaxID=1945593 RepID=UPI00216BBE96|nr:sodium ion-translocating decarboxylase subunit beta [Oscillibacter sp.]MCI9113167.1 sodium ion-translocating decarboxylase subunit beta [Oscillibacter sp.]